MSAMPPYCAPETYTTDVADNVIRYGVHIGFDAWRNLYHHHAPLAADLQHIFIQELFELKPVSGSDVDKLLAEMQRTPEWYTQAGTDSIAEQWLVSAIKRNVLLKILTDLFMELRQFNTVD